MRKTTGATLLLSLALLLLRTTVASASASFAEEVSRRDLNLGAKEKITRLHFYFHDSVTDKPPSVVRIAQAPETDASPTLFGALVVADDPLTVGPEPTSREVGRAQGMYASVARKEANLILAMSFSLTEGKYNGSSFTVLTRNPEMQTVRELGVVGGTGVFRFARGFVVARTHSVNPFGAVVDYYNVTLLRY